MSKLSKTHMIIMIVFLAVGLLIGILIVPEARSARSDITHLACSASGQLVFVVANGELYISDNYGQSNWIKSITYPHF